LVTSFTAAVGGGPSGLLGALMNTVLSQNPVLPTGSWPSLNKALVVARLNDLKGNANLFDQGNVGLCTAAAFYHHTIQKDPLQFHLFATGLYAQGLGFLGKLKIASGDDLRNMDYNILANRFGTMPPQADWMLMSALCDSANWFFDFEGTPDEDTAINTSAGEMSDWYRQTGFYATIAFSKDRDIKEIKKIKKTADNHISLWVAIRLLGDARNSTHMINLNSQLLSMR
jgi:hypothetical protein